METKYRIYVRNVDRITDLSAPVKMSQLTLVFDPDGYDSDKEAKTVIQKSYVKGIPVNYIVMGVS